MGNTPFQSFEPEEGVDQWSASCDVCARLLSNRIARQRFDLVFCLFFLSVNGKTLWWSMLQRLLPLAHCISRMIWCEKSWMKLVNYIVFNVQIWQDGLLIASSEATLLNIFLNFIYTNKWLSLVWWNDTLSYYLVYDLIGRPSI